MRPGLIAALIVFSLGSARAATTQKRYYAHEAVEDEHGVIAPWYTGSNGQVDWRVRIAAETLKRYPWSDASNSARALPHYMWSGHWRIDKDGAITTPPLENWANGDFGQRAAYVMAGWVDYYRYTGDPAAIAHMTLQAEMLLDFCQTPADHPWPRFLISVPVRGKPYGQADPHGFIQLDNTAEAGIPLVKVAQITGNKRFMEAARHWGDLLAEKRDRRPGVPPWGRYANPQDVPWEDNMTGNVVFLLEFFDTLIASGYTGRNDAIVEARKAGVAYLQWMLKQWLVHDTWGRNFWDWNAPVQLENVTEFVARYVMEHPDEFPHWRTDARNILTLFLNRTSVSPKSNADVFSGAWAYPESSGCCGRSLWYGPLEIAPMYAQLGAMANDALMAELGRRQMILATYDAHETGVVEDNIDGGQIVAGSWFKIAHPMALKHCLNMIAWQPEVFAPPYENHIVRSTSTVTRVAYGPGRIAYETSLASGLNRPEIDVLRLAFEPTNILAGGQKLEKADLSERNAYELLRLSTRDWLLTIRHDHASQVVITGVDHEAGRWREGITYSGKWTRTGSEANPASVQHETSTADATIECEFEGNRVHLAGYFGPDGGLADVYLDGAKQLVGIDAWCPSQQQGVLFWRNGLENRKHQLRVIARGTGNPVSKGAAIRALGVWSSQLITPQKGLGSGGGPGEAQRWIFGYPERTDYVDSAGSAWRPATEWVVRAANLTDSVAAHWWTSRRCHEVEGTGDPELYRYGAHGKEFWADFTVAPRGGMPTAVGGHGGADQDPKHADANGRRHATHAPGAYHVRLKFVETRNIEPKLRATNIWINGREVAREFDIASTAKGERSQKIPATDPGYARWTGLGRAVDLVFNGIEPKNGVISIRFSGSHGGEAIVQAIEVGPGDGGEGATPVKMPASQPEGS